MSAFAIPNTFRRLFGEGALAAAFIPEYASLLRQDPASARRFASLTVAVLFIITGAITVLGEIALLALLAALPPNAERSLSLQLIMVMLPFMPLICVAATLGGMLQVHDRFGPHAAQPIVLNARLRNVPEKAIYNWDPGAHFGIYRPDTFWYAEDGT